MLDWFCVLRLALTAPREEVCVHMTRVTYDDVANFCVVVEIVLTFAPYVCLLPPSRMRRPVCGLANGGRQHRT